RRPRLHRDVRASRLLHGRSLGLSPADTGRRPRAAGADGGAWLSLRDAGQPGRRGAAAVPLPAAARPRSVALASRRGRLPSVGAGLAGPPRTFPGGAGDAAPGAGVALEPRDRCRPRCVDPARLPGRALERVVPAPGTPPLPRPAPA